MTHVVSRFDDLRTSLSGTVVTPEDPGYDEARRVWNADIDRRPAAVVYCATTEDVARAVSFARDARSRCRCAAAPTRRRACASATPGS